ncbi:protein of unknown function (plasmid) [Methylocella tundrae]|uniref:Uncharacterized protein n=1 Tax=Methylocella tundrae TaxID=227605 RepID=A0A4U8Z7M6_METTU|nr:protein of unknown function [Methylocella tundrae]
MATLNASDLASNPCRPSLHKLIGLRGRDARLKPRQHATLGAARSGFPQNHYSNSGDRAAQGDRA